MKIDPLPIYKLANKLYSYNFNLYKYLYFMYKNVSEKNEINFIKKNVKSGLRIIDIGANVGFYTTLFSGLVGKYGIVYAFEPEKNNFRNLKTLCNKRKNIILNNSAAGDKNGKIRLYVSDTLNVDHCTFDNNKDRKSSLVKCLSIDKYLKRGEKVDLVKIDTQGFEYNILMGMKKTLSLSKNVILLCEIYPEGLRYAGVSAGKIFHFLKECGFKIKCLDGSSLKIFHENQLQNKKYINIVASRSF